MTNHYDRADWYDGILADQELLGLHRSISEAKKGAKSANPNKVIAEFSFGFWTTLLNARYQNQLWASLKYAFPHSPQKQRKPISKGINRVRILRNRISHHEPVLWLEPGVEAEYQHIYNVLAWINPGILAWTRNIDRFPDLLPVINSPVLIEQNS